MPVQYWSSAAASVLQQQQVVGWVHSCYAGIVNLRTPSGRLVTLQAPGPLQAPLALTLARGLEILVPRLSIGALVLQHTPETADIPAALRLVYAGAQERDGRIQPIPSLTATVLSQRANALTVWMRQHVPGRGLAPLITAVHGYDQALPAVCRRVATALVPLLTGRPSTAAMLGLASQVVGLGEGLTPSGDDLCVGLLAVLQATGWLPRVLPTAAQQQFLQGVTGKTSDLSAEFLRCALEGQFAEPVARLIQPLFAPDLHGWQAPAAALAAVGHSSGVDALVGIVLGGRLLARWREQQDGRLTFPEGGL